MSTNLKIVKDINGLINNSETLDPNYVTFVKISSIVSSMEGLIECDEDDLYSYIETPKYKQLIKEAKELYGFECLSTFSITDNYVIIHSGDTFIVDGHKFKVNEHSFVGFGDLRKQFNYTKISDSLNLTNQDI